LLAEISPLSLPDNSNARRKHCTSAITTANYQYIHLFSTPSHRYCYDAHTNAILELDPVTWHVLHDGQRLSVQHDVELPDEYIELLNMVLLEGGLQVGGSPRRLGTSWQRDDIERELGSNVAQLTLIVTEGCNLSCSYCVLGRHYPAFAWRSSRRMSPDVAERAIDFFLQCCRKDKPISIGFYGGEPLTNFALIEHCLEYVRQQSDSDLIGFNMTTNATLLDADKIAVLRRHNVLLAVSLDGPRLHCYDIPGLPRTNNDRESEFRDLNRRLLSTTGQNGLVKRIIQREGAWELIPRPAIM
jgi:uncharacterized protein